MEQVFHAVRLEVQGIAANGEVVAPLVPGPDGEPRPARAELSGFFFTVTEVVNAEQAKRTGLKEGSETTNAVKFPCAPAVAKLLAAGLLDALGDADYEPPADPRDGIKVVSALPTTTRPNREQRRRSR